jgi:hypothetical protein
MHPCFSPFLFALYCLAIKKRLGRSIESSVASSVRLKDRALFCSGRSAIRRKAFEVVYSPHKPGSATDDEVFGTKEPKAFGESWPINAKLGSEDVKKSGIEVSPEHLNGRTELVGKERIGEADCLSVRGELVASGVALKDLPGGATVDEGTMQLYLLTVYR